MAVEHDKPRLKREARRNGLKPKRSLKKEEVVESKVTVHRYTPLKGMVMSSQDEIAALRASGALALEEAREAGLLEGESTEHVSFRAPKALLEAARRQTGETSTTKLGIAALAMLAQPDPAAEFLTRNFGRLGEDHDLEY